MARQVGKLKALDVARARTPGMYSDGGGLNLLVGPSGAKSWIFRYRAGGKIREMGLGPVHTVGLGEARQRAQNCRRQRLDGEDPIELRKAARQRAQLDAATAMTFKQGAAAYIAAHSAGWRNAKHVAQWSTTLATYAFPVFGDLSMQAIDVGLVMKAIEPIWVSKPETAGRVRGRIESVLDWATARGYRAGENPARWRGHLENLLPKKSKVRAVVHHTALPYGEIAAFMAELRAEEGIAARALEFTILCASRTGEVIGARWSEIDLDARLWTIPGERMKAGREHRVPLSEPAVAILTAMSEVREGDFVFPGGKVRKPISNMAMTMLLRRMQRTDCTVHGFRSTFSDWCAEQTSTPSEVREMALAHAVGDKVEAAYRRGDLFAKRRQLAEAWARFCTTAPSNTVVELAIGAAR